MGLFDWFDDDKDKDKCPKCNGKGTIEEYAFDENGKAIGYYNVTCPRCNGSGTI